MTANIRQSVVQLVYLSHPQWPLRAGAPLSARPLQIAILDSSFNPPTLAHLALINHSRPTYKSLDPYLGDYDAKLLLLSVRNADKLLKHGDATYEQRLEMMKLLAQDVQTDRTPFRTVAERKPNVAIAMVDEPTFVGKSSLLVEFLGNRIKELSSSKEEGDSAPQRPNLTFLLGFDTLERFFASRYYAADKDADAEEQMRSALFRFFSPEADNSRIVCAKRPTSSHPMFVSASPSESARLSAEKQDKVSILLASINAFLQTQSLSIERVSMIDIGEDISTLSSTVVRQSLARRDPTWKECVTDEVCKYLERTGLYKDLDRN